MLSPNLARYQKGVYYTGMKLLSNIYPVIESLFYVMGIRISFPISKPAWA